MTEQSGQSIDALQSRLDALSQRHTAIAEADGRLAELVSSAHAVTAAALARLDRIGQEIEAAVEAQRAAAVETPIGGRELQRFLLDKHHEIIAVVTEARTRADAETAAAQQLLSQYRPGGAVSV